MRNRWELLSQAPKENTSTGEMDPQGSAPAAEQKAKARLPPWLGKEIRKVKAPTLHHGEESFLLNILSCTSLEEESVPEHRCCLQATQPHRNPTDNQ